MATLIINYEDGTRCATLKADAGVSDTSWTAICRVYWEKEVETTELAGRSISLQWWQFSRYLAELREILQDREIQISVTDLAKAQLMMVRERISTYELRKLEPWPEGRVLDILGSKRFNRKLFQYQLENVAKLARIGVGASFSVPGSGKTTEALALFALLANPSESLLIVAPKNAFMAWEDEYPQCLPDRALAHPLRRLRSSDTGRLVLVEDPRSILISYALLANNVDQVGGWMQRNPSTLVIDESHRMKKGNAGKHGGAILSIASLASHRWLLSGTPMPQGPADLVPQFQVLFPEVSVEAENAGEKFQGVFVRTTKQQLDLPPLRVLTRKIAMLPGQRRLYDVMVSEAAKKAESVDLTRRAEFRKFAMSVQRLLQVASNPLLLASSLLAEDPLVREALDEGISSKMREVVRITTELARKGHKVVVWSSFVESVKHLAALLADFGAELIYGGTLTSELEEVADSREGIIRRFNDKDSGCRVLVANPAACSEGISLHHVCHHAVFLDRNFNAAQYLQSRDRVHRIGVRREVQTYIYVAQSEDSIDQVVHQRIESKVKLMGKVLNDPGLSVPPFDLDGVDDDFEGFNQQDIKAVLALFRGPGRS